MALIKCIECGKEVSEYAEYCLSCGCPVYVSEPQLALHQDKKMRTKIASKPNTPENVLRILSKDK